MSLKPLRDLAPDEKVTCLCCTQTFRVGRPHKARRKESVCGTPACYRKFHHFKNAETGKVVMWVDQ